MFLEAQEKGGCPEPTLLSQSQQAAVLASFCESHTQKSTYYPDGNKMQHCSTRHTPMGSFPLPAFLRYN